MITIDPIQWSDIHQDIETGPDGNIQVSIDAEAVKTSVSNILRTALGERVMRPEFGSILPGLVFKSLTQETRKAITDGIKEAIERWEDRVSIAAVDVVFETDNNFVQITIRFSIAGLERQYEASVTL